MLLANTKYAAYLVFQSYLHSSGFAYLPAKVLVATGARQICTKLVYLDPNLEESLRQAGCEDLSMWEFPKRRADGWLEVELGHFEYLHVDDVEMQISVKDEDTSYVKHGLNVLGIEIRTKI